MVKKRRRPSRSKAAAAESRRGRSGGRGRDNASRAPAPGEVGRPRSVSAAPLSSPSSRDDGGSAGGVPRRDAGRGGAAAASSAAETSESGAAAAAANNDEHYENGDGGRLTRNGNGRRRGGRRPTSTTTSIKASPQRGSQGRGRQGRRRRRGVSGSGADLDGSPAGGVSNGKATDGNGDGDAMEDVMAQLRRQRAKAAAQRRDEELSSNGNGAAAVANGTAANRQGRSCDVTTTDDDGGGTSSSARPPPKKRIGGYVYDLARGRYFPESEVGDGGKSRVGADYEENSPPAFAPPTLTSLHLSRRHLPVPPAAARSTGTSTSTTTLPGGFVLAALAALRTCPMPGQRRARLASDAAVVLTAARAKIVPPTRRVEDVRAEEDDGKRKRLEERREARGRRGGTSCRRLGAGTVEDGSGGESAGGEDDEEDDDASRARRTARRRRRRPLRLPPSSAPPPASRAAAPPNDDDDDRRPGEPRNPLLREHWRKFTAPWRYLLPPLEAASRRGLAPDSYVNSPLDCVVQGDLHPCARTFDVLPDEDGRCLDSGVDAFGASASSTSSRTPHVVTISERSGVARSGYPTISYRPPREVPYAAYKAGGEHEAREVHLLPEGDTDRRFYSVRFAPMPKHENGTVTVAALGKIVASNTHMLSLGRVRDGTVHGRNLMIQIPDEMNDMAFSPRCAYGQSPSHIALAPTRGQSARSDAPLSPCFVDLQAMRCVSPGRGWGKGIASDAFCVEYLDDASEAVVLYGHRSGDVSILDTRSGTFAFLRKESRKRAAAAAGGSGTDDFGSVSSLHATVGGRGAAARDNASGRHWNILARGSFGALRLFDIRRLGGSSSGRGRGGSGGDFSDPSLLLSMNPPDDAHGMRTTRCSGMALDPSGMMVLSPYACRRDRSVRLGFWSLRTGQLVKDVTLAGGKPPSPADSDPRSPESDNHMFCELSRTVTGAWEYGVDYSKDSEDQIAVRRQKGSWGLWLKSNRQLEGAFLSKGPQQEAGGIHHMTFPGGV